MFKMDDVNTLLTSHLDLLFRGHSPNDMITNFYKSVLSFIY